MILLSVLNYRDANRMLRNQLNLEHAVKNRNTPHHSQMKPGNLT